MYYVSYVTEYPIYEAAEGGYYYAGETVQMCRAFQTWRKARRFYNKIRADFLERFGFETDRINDFQPGGICKWGDGPVAAYYGKYIGDGERVQITRYEPHDKGYQPYY